MTDLTLSSALDVFTRRLIVTPITIMGKMSQYKTNTCKVIYRHLSRQGFTTRYIRAATTRRAINAMSEPEPDVTKWLIILDDVSFLATMSAPDIMEFQNVVASVRHLLKPEGYNDTDMRIVIVWVFHYYRSIMPFFRETPISILTTITKQEISSLRDVYEPRNLKAFFKLYDASIWEPDSLSIEENRRPILLHALTREGVVTIPRIDEPIFETIANRCQTLPPAVAVPQHADASQPPAVSA